MRLSFKTPRLVLKSGDAVSHSAVITHVDHFVNKNVRVILMGGNLDLAVVRRTLDWNPACYTGDGANASPTGGSLANQFARMIDAAISDLGVPLLPDYFGWARDSRGQTVAPGQTVDRQYY